MSRVWFPSMILLSLSQTALAAELPDSARGLVPSTWSVDISSSVDDRNEWILAAGGEELVQLVRRSDRVVSVATADAQVVQAEGRALQSMAGLLPSVSASASWQTGTPNGAFAALGDSNSMDQYSASADLTVPLSLWTAVPDQRAARADRLGAEAALDDARATAAIDLAAALLDVAQARERLDVVERQLVVEQELLTLTEARYGAGEVTGVDVLRQRQQLASTTADLPAAQADVGRAERAVAALLRLPTTELPTMPTRLPEPVILSLPHPDELIGSHPSVRQALRDWEASRSRTRSARAGLLPNLALTGSTGVRYTELVDTEITPTWSAGVQATVPFFDGGATFGRIRSASGTQSQALVTLEQTIVDTVREVEDALALWEQAARVRTATDDAERMAVEAQQAAQAGYAAGTSTYNTVLTALQTVRSTRQSALLAQRDHVDAALAVVSVTRATWTEEIP